MIYLLCHPVQAFFRCLKVAHTKGDEYKSSHELDSSFSGSVCQWNFFCPKFWGVPGRVEATKDKEKEEEALWG